jgi:hypothetical protein
METDSGSVSLGSNPGPAAPQSFCETEENERAGILLRPFLHHVLHQHGPASLRERLLHGRDRAVLHLGQDVGVCVHRLRCDGMPQHLLVYLGVRALAKEDRGGGVPEVVKPYPGEPGALQERPERVVSQVAHVKGRPDGRSENEVVLSPEGPGGEPRCFSSRFRWSLRASMACPVSLTERVLSPWER